MRNDWRSCWLDLLPQSELCGARELSAGENGPRIRLGPYTGVIDQRYSASRRLPELSFHDRIHLDRLVCERKISDDQAGHNRFCNARVSLKLARSLAWALVLGRVGYCSCGAVGHPCFFRRMGSGPVVWVLASSSAADSTIACRVPHCIAATHVFFLGAGTGHSNEGLAGSPTGLGHAPPSHPFKPAPLGTVLFGRWQH